MSSEHAPAGGTTRWLRPRVVVPALVVLLAVMMVVGGRLGRAETIGSYRPELPPSAFAGVCNPFPSGFAPDVEFQVRADRTLELPSGAVRRLDLHYDVLDADTVRERVDAAATAAGLSPVAAREGDDPAVDQWYESPGYGRLGVGVEAFPDAVEPDTAVVQGRLTIDVPTDTLTPVVEASCSNPVQTKRFDFEAYADDDD